MHFLWIYNKSVSYRAQCLLTCTTPPQPQTMHMNWLQLWWRWKGGLASLTVSLLVNCYSSTLLVNWQNFGASTYFHSVWKRGNPSLHRHRGHPHSYRNCEMSLRPAQVKGLSVACLCYSSYGTHIMNWHRYSVWAIMNRIGGQITLISHNCEVCSARV